MDSRFTIEEGRYGRQLVLQSSWSDDVGRFMRSEGIKELYLNYARGFVGDDISFVSQLPELEVLWIIHRTIDDVSPIHALHELRSLKVDTYCRTAIDFSQFPRLEHCYLEWRKGVESLFDRPHLEELFINKYDQRHTDDVGRLQTLQKLSLGNAPTDDLEGLSNLHSLRFLGLYRLRRLGSLRGIESLRALTTLEIQECNKLDSLDEIGNLVNLRRLLLIDLGKVASIRFLANLGELEEVLFYGTTHVEDGDLTPLTRLAKLQNLSFRNRRHYTHKREQFEQY